MPFDFSGLAGIAAGLGLNGFINNYWDLRRIAFTVAPARIDPLLIDLDGDGIETTYVNNRVYFDHNADGFKEKSGWVSADDGLLVYDKNGNGTIDSGRELFGTNTEYISGILADSGYEALERIDLKICA